MKVRISAGFRQKLTEQVTFIALDKPGAARKFKNDLLARIRELPAMPYKHRRSIFFDSDEIRDLLFKGYLVVYKIEEKQILVFGFVKYEGSLEK